MSACKVCAYVCMMCDICMYYVVCLCVCVSVWYVCVCVCVWHVCNRCEHVCVFVWYVNVCGICVYMNVCARVGQHRKMGLWTVRLPP